LQLGMIGLGRVGGKMARPLMRGGHQRAVFDLNPENVSQLGTRRGLVASLTKSRAEWVMVPSGAATEGIVKKLAGSMEEEDVPCDVLSPSPSRASVRARTTPSRKGCSRECATKLADTWNVPAAANLKLAKARRPQSTFKIVN
jgi:6-phosphogluconate dehydrogenase (decarboxylating)